MYFKLHSIFARLLAFASLLCSTVGQSTHVSAPFSLHVRSSNKTIDGTILEACHEGAAIEGLCIIPATKPPASFAVYHLNTTIVPGQPIPPHGRPGTLTFSLPIGPGLPSTVSEPMGLSVDPISNVAIPQFVPGYQITQVAFDDENRMNIQGYFDDRYFPVKMGSSAYYRWYVCETYTEGYVYLALAWVLGDDHPENPTCVKVAVVRVFL